MPLSLTKYIALSDDGGNDAHSADDVKNCDSLFIHLLKAICEFCSFFPTLRKEFEEMPNGVTYLACCYIYDGCSNSHLIRIFIRHPMLYG